MVADLGARDRGSAMSSEDFGPETPELPGCMLALLTSKRSGATARLFHLSRSEPRMTAFHAPCGVGTIEFSRHFELMLCRSLAAAALLFTSACEQADDPNPEYRPSEAGTVDHAMCLLGFTAIPLREVATGHHLLEASINGTSGNFILDTGANVTVVNSTQAEQFGVSAESRGRPAAFGGLAVPGASGRASQVAVDSFEIGPVILRQDRVVTADLEHLLAPLGRIAGQEVAGIIGQDVLTEHRAIIDVARPMLYLMMQDEDPAPIAEEKCRETTQESEPAA